MCPSWLIHVSFMTHSWLIHDSFMTHSWLIHDSFMTLSWLIHESFMTHSWLIHDSFMTHSCVIHVSFICHSCVWYGVALVSRIDKMIGLFCKRALQKRRYSAKVTYNLIDPTDRSHPIVTSHNALLLWLSSPYCSLSHSRSHIDYVTTERSTVVIIFALLFALT